jgi:Cu+-exporting ATPase
MILKKERFNITGMSCSACSARVEKSVKAVDGVIDNSVNLLTGTMDTTYDEKATDEQKIIQAVIKSGYGASPVNDRNEKQKSSKDFNTYDNETKNLKKRFIISACFLIPLMFIAMYHMIPFRPAFLDAAMSIFVGPENSIIYSFSQFLLLIPIIFVNRIYYERGFRSLFHASPNMDSLIALGSSAAAIYGIYAIFAIGFSLGRGNLITAGNLSHDVYFESSGTILTLITLGKWLESISKKKTGDSISKLISLSPDTAVIEKNGTETLIKSEDIKIGDIIIIRAGGRIPVDGVIIDGSAYIDESALTGESLPLFKNIGENVISASIVNSGYIKINAEHVGNDTTINKMIKVVEEASATKAPIARIADKVSGVFVPFVISAALLTLIIWLLTGATFEFALSACVSVLIISCPCALGLATPVAIMVGTGKGAENGILIKSGESLETAHSIQAVMFDKTGTITEGRPEVTDVVSVCELSSDDFLKKAASLEQKSEHPFAKAITNKCDSKSLDNSDHFISNPGMGITANICNQTWAGGNKAFFDSMGISVTEVQGKIKEFSSSGKTPLIFSRDGKIAGIIAVADVIKRSSSSAVAALQSMGIKTIMLTGDNEITANAIARQAGISEIYAGVLPTEKESIVKKIQKDGTITAMVGDGINDAPALTRSDVGIVIGTGNDIAIDNADIILMKNDLTDIPKAIQLSKAVIKNIKENLFWAFFYNLICIPLAAGVYYPLFGIMLNPMIGAAAMSLSSISVVLNALRLRRFKYKTENKEDKISERKEKEMKEKLLTMNIEGMMCAHCKATVEKALKAVQGVTSVDVSLENNNAKIKALDSVNPKSLTDAVTNAGYTVINIE